MLMLMHTLMFGTPRSMLGQVDARVYADVYAYADTDTKAHNRVGHTGEYIWPGCLTNLNIVILAVSIWC